MTSLNEIVLKLLKKLLAQQIELGEQGDAEQIRELTSVINKLENEVIK